MSSWPSIDYNQWKDTQATLHLWLQIAGKIRLVQTPWVNHSWNVPLYVTSRGVTTSPIPYGERTFEINFDFIDHQLLLEDTSGGKRVLPLQPMTVAEFYAQVIRNLGEMGIDVAIVTAPSEIVDGIPFEKDTTHKSYDAEAVHRYWQVLVQMDRVFKEFRSHFIGKNSPVHFFWGGMDLAVTRFSGRPAPKHAGGVPHMPDWVAIEAYSHEVSSAGFWPGSDDFPKALVYSYAYPQPDGFDTAALEPPAAMWSKDMGEFVLLYEDLVQAPDPEATLLAYLQSAYEAAANAAKWDRGALERSWEDRP